MHMDAQTAPKYPSQDGGFLYVGIPNETQRTVYYARHFHTIAVSEDKGKGEGPMKFLWKCGSLYSLVGDRHCGAR